MKMFANLASQLTILFKLPDNHKLAIGLRAQQSKYPDKLVLMLRATFELVQEDAHLQDADRLVNIDLYNDKIVVSVPNQENKPLRSVNIIGNECDYMQYDFKNDLERHWICEKFVQ